MLIVIRCHHTSFPAPLVQLGQIGVSGWLVKQSPGATRRIGCATGVLIVPWNTRGDPQDLVRGFLTPEQGISQHPCPRIVWYCHTEYGPKGAQSAKGTA